MKKVFMLLMIAGSAVMFTACGGNSNETVVESDTVSAETEYEIERTTVEVDTTTETETVTTDTTVQQ